MNDKEEKQQLVEKAADMLGEHFDSVRIICTHHSGDGTMNTKMIDTGRGNFYAQCGSVQEWLVVQNQYQKNWAIKKDKESE